MADLSISRDAVSFRLFPSRISAWLLSAFALMPAPALTAETVQQQARRVEAALARITQEQQALYHQFQMVQDLRRNDERQMLPLPTYAPASPPNYDDLRREETARADRVRQYQYELDRLYARYRELEEQKRPLLETLSVLAQQRDEPPEAATDQRKPAPR